MEIVVGVVILAFAALPIFWISSSTTRSAALTGRHLMASQIGQSLLEWFIAQPYKDAVKQAKDLGKTYYPVNEDLIFQRVAASICPNDLEKAMSEFHRVFRSMEYEIDVDEREEPKHGKIAVFQISILYRLVEDTSSQRNFTLSALKFPEDI